MPRSFSEEERTHIRSLLLAAGRALVERHGPRRTSVDELARAAGISKGAFYLFFASKEDLVFEVLEGAEAEFRAAVFGRTPPHGERPRVALQALLREAILTWKRTPLLRAVTLDEYGALMVRLPAERLRAHRAADAAATAEFADRWRAAGLLGQGDPHLLTELMRALFFVSLHDDGFDDGVFPQVIDTLTELIAARFAAEDTP